MQVKLINEALKRVQLPDLAAMTEALNNET